MCSPSNGAVSADVVGTGELPTLLYATSLMSISFSNFRACFRKTERKTHTNTPHQSHRISTSIGFRIHLPSQSDVPITARWIIHAVATNDPQCQRVVQLTMKNVFLLTKIMTRKYSTFQMNYVSFITLTVGTFQTVNVKRNDRNM